MSWQPTSIVERVIRCVLYLNSYVIERGKVDHYFGSNSEYRIVLYSIVLYCTVQYCTASTESSSEHIYNILLFLYSVFILILTLVLFNYIFVLIK